VFYWLGPETPLKLFDKTERDERPATVLDAEKKYTVVEAMNDDGLDAKKSFFASSIWEGTGFLSAECKEWEMFKCLPDLYHPGWSFKPPQDFDFALHFRRLIKIHEGEVRMVTHAAAPTDWKHYPSPPPRDMTYWHCQYYKYGPDGRQGTGPRKVAEDHGCRGAPRSAFQQRHDWAMRPELSEADLLAIGSSSICHLPANGTLDTHYRRCGPLVSYPRFLLFLLHCGGVSMQVSELWWRTKDIICHTKVRQTRKDKFAT